MFMGEYTHSIDSKGRLIIPAKFRELLGTHFIVTRGLDRCLFGYPLNEWEQLQEKLKVGLIYQIRFVNMLNCKRSVLW